MRCYKIWISYTKNKEITQQLIYNYLVENKNRRNNLALFKILYPEHTKDLKFPKRTFKPKFLPSEEQIQVFYDALPDHYKPIFLLLRESGLRISDLLGAQLDPVNQMIIPAPHSGATKHSWISFYRSDIKQIPKFNQDSITHTFLKTSKICGVTIYPHLLRSVFARDCTKRGIPDRYIDAFCGRVPASVLARHYSDFSPEVLKEIYDKADIHILE